MPTHETEEQLAASIAEAETAVEVGATYKHYKGMGYTVLAIALEEATCEPCVVYQAQYGNRITYTRPLASWLEQVVVEGAKVSRFARIVDKTQE